MLCDTNLYPQKIGEWLNNAERSNVDEHGDPIPFPVGNVARKRRGTVIKKHVAKMIGGNVTPRPNKLQAYYKLKWEVCRDLINTEWFEMDEEARIDWGRMKFCNNRMRTLLKSESEDVVDAVNAYIANWKPASSLSANIPSHLRPRIEKAVFQQKYV